MSYQLSTEQVEALRAIGSWYRSKSQPFLTLGGYAGTGKSTLIAYVRKALKENDPDTRVAFCAFTGKAVRVLEMTLKKNKVSRSGDNLSTIHSLIYNSILDSNGHVIGWKLKPNLEFDLIIVDEASMVTADIWSDLLSFKIPVLVVGDHGQLPPVAGNFNLMSEPQLKLERIFRQQELSPIVDVATMARTNGYIPPGVYGEDVVKYDRRGENIGLEMEEIIQGWQPDWLVLCGYNHTRTKLNSSLRVQAGFVEDRPVVGDHVICLKNNATSKLYNGMTGVISDIRRPDNDEEDLWYLADISFEDFEYEGLIFKNQFGAKETVSQLPAAPDGKRGDLFDYGYALTVHKAQGSSSETVLLFEERNRHMSDEDWRRWLYTAVTRAETKLIIIGD